MSLWFSDYNLDQINQQNKNTMVEHCGIEITEMSDETLTGTMPADSRNKQPFGIVHGGANCVLAETLGRIAANMTCNPTTHHAVGLSITTNHLRPVRNGVIIGIATPVKIGKTTQVWDIKTFDEAKRMTSQTSFTVMIVNRL